MGDTGHGGGYRAEQVVPDESVTGAGGPVLLASSAPELGRGDVLAGRYQVEASIGMGGSGRVLRAFDRVARELVALKILRPEYAADPVWTERFSRELRVGRQIQHKNVCRIFDIGEADGHRFLSMELATRGTVRGQIGAAALERPLDQRVADARAVIEGVAALHGAGIVHRDLKPENLLRMEDGRLVVSDFGLATDPGSGPATTVMIGTPRYMAQEVVMGDPATARSDVWALGVVLHEILFGARPDRSVIRWGMRRYTPPTTKSLRERRLAELCGRCTEDDPAMRPASATEVLQEFEAAALGRRLKQGFRAGKVTWGGIALAVLAAMYGARVQWTSRAAASSSLSAAVSSKQVGGAPADWSKNSMPVASFSGRLHCFSSIAGGKVVRAIWGSPRQAEDIDVHSGARTPSDLLPETYAEGCPDLAANGKDLLFARTSETGKHVFLSSLPNGQGARQLVRGAGPKWLPSTQEFVFAVDSRHAGLFSIPAGDVTLVVDGDNRTRQLNEYDVDAAGKRLAVMYTTNSTENLLVIHSLPGLEVIGRTQTPVLSRRLRFTSGGTLTFMTDGPQGFGQLAAVDLGDGVAVRRVGGLPDGNVLGVLQRASDLLVAGAHLRKDLWRQTPSGDKRVTWDGDSTAGAMSADGRFLIQKNLQDGRYVLILRAQDGTESQMTEGPLDLTPSFSPDGKSWLFAKPNRGEIFRSATSPREHARSCTWMRCFPLTPSLIQRVSRLRISLR